MHFGKEAVCLAVTHEAHGWCQVDGVVPTAEGVTVLCLPAEGAQRECALLASLLSGTSLEAVAELAALEEEREGRTVCANDTRKLCVDSVVLEVLVLPQHAVVAQQQRRLADALRIHLRPAVHSILHQTRLADVHALRPPRHSVAVEAFVAACHRLRQLCRMRPLAVLATRVKEDAFVVVLPAKRVFVFGVPAVLAEVQCARLAAPYRRRARLVICLVDLSVDKAEVAVVVQQQPCMVLTPALHSVHGVPAVLTELLVAVHADVHGLHTVVSA